MKPVLSQDLFDETRINVFAPDREEAAGYIRQVPEGWLAVRYDDPNKFMPVFKEKDQAIEYTFNF